MPRAKLDMTEETWQRVKVWVQHFVDAGTQGEINLSGTGEPTLHPQLARWCLEMREIIGPDGSLKFTTNGTNATEQLARALVPSKPGIAVTVHHAKQAQAASYLYARYRILRGLSFDPVQAPQNWAGQVNCPSPWTETYDLRPVCRLLAEACGSINADGTFVMCCMDGSNESARGTVWDDPATTSITVQDWRLCPACWQVPPKD
jgi:hypothetical protein